MKKKIAAVMGVLCLLAAGGLSVRAEDAEKKNAESSVARGALRVEGTGLVDENGEKIQLKGISTHGIGWFPDYINEECFRQLHEEWNVDVIRLAMYTAESGGYCTDGDQEYLKGLVKAGVSYATENDMYVIIDWHILSDNNPNLHVEEAKDFFREMSSEYEDYDNVLYEICNEPNGDTTWNEIKAYAEEVIPVIRENDEDAVILVGTPNWSQYVDQAAENPITEYGNIMYVLHFYAATHKEELRNTMVSAIEKGVPVFVSEYGICDASGNGAIDEEQANQWVNLMDQYGVSYVAWNLSNKEETSAILDSACTKTSGFEAEDMSASGRWLYKMLTGEDVSESEEGQFKEDGQADSKEDLAEPADTGAADDGRAAFADGEIEIQADIVNSWEADGQYFFQYNLTLKNTAQTGCMDWNIEMPFNAPFSLSDGWNGEYTADGQTLYIKNKEYNGNIPSGETVGDIGFIVSGERTLAYEAKDGGNEE